MKFNSFTAQCWFLFHFYTLHVLLLFSFLTVVLITVNFHNDEEIRNMVRELSVNCSRYAPFYKEKYMSMRNRVYANTPRPPYNNDYDYRYSNYGIRYATEYWVYSVLIDRMNQTMQTNSQPIYFGKSFAITSDNLSVIKSSGRTGYIISKNNYVKFRDFSMICTYAITADRYVISETYERAEIGTMVSLIILGIVWICSGWVMICIPVRKNLAYRVYLLCGAVYTLLVICFVILEICAPFLFPPTQGSQIYRIVVVISLHVFWVLFCCLTFTTWKCRHQLGVDSVGGDFESAPYHSITM